MNNVVTELKIKQIFNVNDKKNQSKIIKSQCKKKSLFNEIIIFSSEKYLL